MLPYVKTMYDKLILPGNATNIADIKPIQSM